MVLSIDLNEVPPESRQFEESAAPTDLQDEQQASHNGSETVPSAIDADAIDDEVILLTAREWYAEVWSQTRRKRSFTIAIDETLETNAEHSGVAMEEPMPIICPDCRNSASLINRMTDDFVVYTRDDVPTVKDARQVIPEAEKEASASPAANESTLICAVCISTLNEPSSTTCGHVFCRGCIENAIKMQKKCPTCRKKLTKRSFHRIYLPSI
ncbi:hypothetical protein M5K25_027417 [Dendrobium thyrsiflorum]|uniref:RING-type domain-containing protein n=1 Tax=Dendrobium thyrsiflorum TaxID=117978 RepID=A0ABD0TZV8_DENTH